MRYYVIINGVNSLTIQGLAISKLPSISKPMMRNMREEIDGRDGDITTELGFGAYDKSLEIGLFGNYDINEIIAFFNSKGTIVFSDEPDKYYNFEILEKIDFEKLLKFKTAIVSIHCQPFKYPLTETPQEIEYEYVSASGDNLSINNTAEAQIKSVQLDGQTSQTTYTGKNLIPMSIFGTMSNNGSGFTYTSSNHRITYNDDTNSGHGVYKSSYYTFTIGTTYTLSYDIRGTAGKKVRIGWNNNQQDYTLKASYERVSFNITASATNEPIVFYTLAKSFGGLSTNEYMEFDNVMITTDGSNTYEPYVGGTASPNPSYPQDVHVVSGDNTIEITGKNIFDEDAILGDYLSGDYYAMSTPQIRGQILLNFKTIKGFVPNTQYTFSCVGYYSSGVYARIKFYYTDGTTSQSYFPTTESFYTITSTANKTIDYILLENAYNSNGSATLIKKGTIQLEANTTATTFEPYTGQTYPLNLGVENLLNKELITASSINWEVIQIEKGVRITHARSYTTGSPSLTLQLKPNTTYTYSQKASNSSGAGIKTTNGSYSYVSTGSVAITTENDGVLIIFYGASLNEGDSCDYTDIQLEIGNKVSSYSPYGAIPIEMASIPNTTYKDLFVKENETWYKRKTIGKVILDGSESWGNINSSTTPENRTVMSIGTLINALNNAYISSMFILNSQTANRIVISSNVIYLSLADTLTGIATSDSNSTKLTKMKTYLSNNNAILYYILNEGTDIEITNETLINQLDALANGSSYEPQTNISQENNDLPFYIEIEVMKKGTNQAIINNDGNIYSKPTIALVGTGIVNIYLNGVQMFQVDLSETNEITIDTEHMEAYNPNDNTLANRKVIGDYSKFKLDVGNNTIKIDGALTSATITNYKRWL